MESALSLTYKPSFHHQKTPFLNPHSFNLIRSNPSYPLLKPFKQSTIKITATTTTVSGDTKPQINPITQTLKLTARSIVLAAVAAVAVTFKFHQYSAVAEPITDTVITTTESETREETETHIPGLLESNSEVINGFNDMKTLLEKKLEAGEDEESLKILKKLVRAEPENLDWKFLMARLLNEMGETEPALEALEQILTQNPLSFEALFENALLMDRCGEGEAVIKRLKQALEIAVDENKEKEAKDVRLIMAQVEFLQKNVYEALRRYDEIISEDPNDFRPYYCKGMIYSFIDKNDEAKVEFAKYRELSPKKFEVEGYLRTPLSRMKLFGTDDQN